MCTVTFSELLKLQQPLPKQILCDKLGWKLPRFRGNGLLRFCRSERFLRLCVAAIHLNAVCLCGEFRPLLFFLFQCTEENSNTKDA